MHTATVELTDGYAAEDCDEIVFQATNDGTQPPRPCLESNPSAPSQVPWALRCRYDIFDCLRPSQQQVNVPGCHQCIVRAALTYMDGRWSMFNTTEVPDGLYRVCYRAAINGCTGNGNTHVLPVLQPVGTINVATMPVAPTGFSVFSHHTDLPLTSRLRSIRVTKAALLFPVP